ncbi:hypothetical protein LRS10_00760 [Phenylobacterium sp. J426]|uniref:hypothetical protein n=1 Tax=Phenylobacterium sp. J426 TaxID=2898439 RepID=UPI00215079B9|nr:hypothetical protein [Phenylobacterium sp. J426]MCR5872850.1 hypothetical protein [Phenylobacterium sp. J426]
MAKIAAWSECTISGRSRGRRSFCWGSWIIPPPKTPGLATYSALLIYEVGFETLKFDQSHFDVRLGNTGVIAFHTRAGAQRVGEDAEDVFFWFFPEAYETLKAKSAGQIAMHRVRA